MAASKRDKQKLILQYPQQLPKPEDLLHFIEMEGFSDDWAQLGLDVDRDLLALQILIMVGGKNSPVVEGTGGLRKLRFSPERWKVGKRGAVRVGFALFEEYGIVLLIVAYAKNDRDDLNAAAKKCIKKLIGEAKQELDRLKRID